MTDLSPAAQAVLDAYEFTADAAADSDDLNALAAALRAAAEQCASNGFGNKWMYTAHVLSIAEELER